MSSGFNWSGCIVKVFWLTYKVRPFELELQQQSSLILLNIFSPSKMCHWRRVRNNYKRCTHYVDLPDEMIQCDDRYCKFSTTHPSTCVPPQCTESCWQYRQFPQQFNPVIDDYCPACIQMGRGQPTSNASRYA